MATAFSGLPFEARMAFREDCERVGCAFGEYVGDGVTVAVGPSFEALESLVKERGWRMAAVWYFPLGSDKPAESLRHAIPGRYDGHRGFWLRAHIVPVSE